METVNIHGKHGFFVVKEHYIPNIFQLIDVEVWKVTLIFMMYALPALNAIFMHAVMINIDASTAAFLGNDK